MTTKNQNMITFASKHHLALHVANQLETLSQQSDGVKHICLSGGSTPKCIFKILAKEPFITRVNWSNLHFWWGDERWVLSTHPESNYGQAKRLLFQFVQNLPEANIHPFNCQFSIEKARQWYSEQMQSKLPFIDDMPQFDWIWLGLGEDGHTASLFPNQNILDSNQWVDITEQPQTAQPRISLTLPIINNAKNVSFLVTGESKAHVLHKIINNNEQSQYPASLVTLKNGHQEWLVDEKAYSMFE